jgi:hypothetical protein
LLAQATNATARYELRLDIVNDPAHGDIPYAERVGRLPDDALSWRRETVRCALVQQKTG